MLCLKDFHSEFHFGTANKLSLLNPNLKISVITPVIIKKGESPEFNSEKKI